MLGRGILRRGRVDGLRARLLLVALFSVGATGSFAGVTHAAKPTTTSVTFSFTGAPQLWTVPAGVRQATFELFGAQGGNSNPDSTGSVSLGGNGAEVTAAVAVKPGQVLQLNVGGAGGPANGSTAVGDAGSGGGASDVRNGAYGLADRLLVAGGGGGAGGGALLCPTSGCTAFSAGGAGGASGAAGGAGVNSSNAGGGGGAGTSTAGGAAGAGGVNMDGTFDPAGTPGSLGSGGAGAETDLDACNGGWGGDGYYGGGGGGDGGFGQIPGLSACGPGGGGGGGSSFIAKGAKGGTTTNGVQSGNGEIIVTY